MSNEDQAQALAASLVPLILEALKPTITEHIDGQISGLKKKNTELLGKLTRSHDGARLTDRNGVPFDVGYTVEMEDRAIAFEKAETERKAADEQSRAQIVERGEQMAAGQNAHYLSREEARNPAKYRAAKEAAREAGKQLVIGSPAEYQDANNPTNANIVTTHVVEDTDRAIRYMSRDRFNELGPSVVNRQAARDGVQVQFFNTDADLPEHLREVSK